MSAVTPDLDYVEIARQQARDERAEVRDKRRGRGFGLFAMGRIFLGAVFVGLGIDMLLDYGGTVASLQETVIDVRPLLPFAIVLQLVLGACLVVGLRARLAARLLAGYLVLAIVLVPPSLVTDLGRAVAFATLGLVSALAMVAAHGAGRLSLDHLLGYRRRRRFIRDAAAKRAQARRG